MFNKYEVIKNMDNQLDTMVVDSEEFVIQKPVGQYPAEYTVMQNRMIEAWNSMSVDEKRIFILASPIVRLNSMSESSKFTITAKEFAEACDIELNSAYSQLKKAADDLRGRYFSYINTKGNRVSVHWVIRIEYGDGKINFYFTNEVLFMLSIFNSNHPYTKFTIKEVLKLKGSHSIQLYQLLKQYELTNIVTITHYIASSVVKRHFLDEYNEIIDNKFGYLKKSIINNIDRFNKNEIEWDEELGWFKEKEQDYDRDFYDDYEISY